MTNSFGWYPTLLGVTQKCHRAAVRRPIAFFFINTELSWGCGGSDLKSALSSQGHISDCKLDLVVYSRLRSVHFLFATTKGLLTERRLFSKRTGVSSIFQYSLIAHAIGDLLYFCYTKKILWSPSSLFAIANASINRSVLFGCKCSEVWSVSTGLVWAERFTSFGVPSHWVNSTTGKQKGITETIILTPSRAAGFLTHKCRASSW